MVSSLWIIGRSSDRPSNEALYQIVQEAADEGEVNVQNFEALQAIESLEELLKNSILKDESEVNSISIVTSENEEDFLDLISQLIRKYSYVPIDLRLIIQKNILSWSKEVINQSITNPIGLFLQRKTTLSTSRRFPIEMALLDLHYSKLITVNFVLEGLFYGSDGLDLKKVLWKIWKNELKLNKTDDEEKNIVLPMINISNYKKILKELIFQEKSPEFLVPAFDLPLQSSVNLFDSLYSKVNSYGWSQNEKKEETFKEREKERVETTEENKEESKEEIKESNEEEKLVIEYDIISSLISSEFSDFSPISSCFNSSSIPVESPFISSSKEFYNDFLQINDLKPLQILFIGPPKSSKSEIIHKLSEKINFPCINIFESVKNILLLDDEELKQRKIVKNEKKNLAIINQILEFRSSLFSFFEAKFNSEASGKKGKNAPPPVSAPTPAALSAIITAQQCSELPQNYKLSSLSYTILLSDECKKKGFFLDIWEKEFNSFEDIEKIYQSIIFNEENLVIEEADEEPGSEVIEESNEESEKEEKKVSFDYVIEFLDNDRWFYNRQYQILGGSAMEKNKEFQANLKNYDAILMEYFNSLIFEGEEVVNPEEVKEEKKEEKKNDKKDKKKEKEEEKKESDDKRLKRNPLVVNWNKTNINKSLIIKPSEISNDDEKLLLNFLHFVRKDRKNAISWVDNDEINEKLKLMKENETLEDVNNSKNIISSSNSIFSQEDEERFYEDEELIEEAKDEVEDKKTSVNKEIIIEKSKIYNDFLSKNVLPILTEAILKAHRNKTRDPITDVANYLQVKSEEMKAIDLQIASENFYKILYRKNSN